VMWCVCVWMTGNNAIQSQERELSGDKMASLLVSAVQDVRCRQMPVMLGIDACMHVMCSPLCTDHLFPAVPRPATGGA
jgi:hypothetical protein